MTQTPCLIRRHSFKARLLLISAESDARDALHCRQIVDAAALCDWHDSLDCQDPDASDEAWAAYCFLRTGLIRPVGFR